MKCIHCSADAEARKEDYMVKTGSCLIIVRHVPCFVCPKCGEMICSVPVTEQLEEYANMVKTVINQLCSIDYEDLVKTNAHLLKRAGL